MSAMRWLLVGAAIAAFAVTSPVLAAVAAPPDANTVATQTITAPDANTDDSVIPPDAPPDTAVPPDDTVPSGSDTGTGADSAMPIPEVEYDFSKLPPPVARLRQQIIDAATTGDPEKLRPIIDANGEPPDFGPEDQGDSDPIGLLKLQSGDEGGREILAILIEVLEAGYVHVDVGTPDEVYLWPYFARYPIDKLTPPQLVELFKLVFAGDYEDMLSNGVYDYFRVGIAPDGTWKFFVQGD
ncbi:MAG TPA: hypothetical protein VG894_06005 [Bauldia sp.]|nr:hypothetical protein [Bauldia sp.]